jgi:RNA polymerase sigma-70 factor (ECF subfamily)
MSSASQTDALLVERIRDGDESAWNELIARFEGRLLAFAESRLGRRASPEDVVQETFIGFLTSLPNYDGRRSLEGYLFSICAHKLTDQLRRQGRRPTVPLSSAADSSGRSRELSGRDHRASSIARSGERRHLEENAIVAALHEQIQRWRETCQWVKLGCIELLFVRGWPNKEVAEELGLSEQQVANFKFDFLARLRAIVGRQGLSSDVFPELYER